VRDSFAASESVELAPNGVAGFRRNGWPTSVGTGGRIASESVAGLARITQLRHVAGTEWSTKRYLSMDFLKDHQPTRTTA